MNLHSEEFNQAFYFDGELGTQYQPQRTTFRLWAPTAEVVMLHDHTMKRSLALSKIDPDQWRGVWQLIIEGDCNGLEYTYEILHDGGRITHTVDPYARAATAHSQRAVVLAPEAPAKRIPGLAMCDAIIWEGHIRDLTIAENNGITNKGKFLGLAEQGTRTTAGNLSGLDYVLSLGVTHIQLLPIFDFGSVDETGDLSFNAQYNWGYDPVLYNVVEGSYATDPVDPHIRIRELKQLINTLHEHGLRVIMDVVYNHVYDSASNPLELTVPGYFFRMRDDGTYHDATACGNETASEQLMMRKFIVDSVVYWAREFAIDGFRFDLMGIHDVETMNAVRSALDEIDPAIIIIGEGWRMGNHRSGVEPADQQHGELMPGIGMFNDCFRDVLKGDNFVLQGAGFVSKNPDFNHHDAKNFGDWAASYGPEQAARAVYDNLLGAQSVRRYRDASQSVVYNEAHDNYTMFDKLAGSATLAGVSEPELARRHALATTIQFLAAGTIFIHAGQELLRTKYGHENSYNLPDQINAFDYDRGQQFPVNHELFKGLVALRKKLAWLRETNYLKLADRTSLERIGEHGGLTISYRIRDAFGAGRHALIAMNASDWPWTVFFEENHFACYLHDMQVDLDPVEYVAAGEFVVQPLTVTLLELWD
ncbi:Pullulanase [Corynebacterium kutscheri]|uniref:type I pullulanase n=1 Tax=Corynebacterium kutscheri TaxID=35755 RepID=UPI000F6BF5E1|nr:type I pullulanase [Corynebacterium kutscheri]VEH80564.1 Pullulanase [Corynebacterium kutscheri]